MASPDLTAKGLTESPSFTFSIVVQHKNQSPFMGCLDVLMNFAFSEKINFLHLLKALANESFQKNIFPSIDGI
jgi:hypothetical protein